MKIVGSKDQSLEKKTSSLRSQSDEVFFSKLCSMEPTIFILYKQSASYIKAVIFSFHLISWRGRWGHYFGLSRLPKLGKTSSLSHGFWNAAAWYCWPILSLWVDTVNFGSILANFWPKPFLTTWFWTKFQMKYWFTPNMRKEFKSLLRKKS